MNTYLLMHKNSSSKMLLAQSKIFIMNMQDNSSKIPVIPICSIKRPIGDTFMCT